MVSAPENGKGKGKDSGSGSGTGSTIRIGASGKVSALMMQELDSNINKTSSATSSATKSYNKKQIQTAPVSISCGVSSKRLQRMISPKHLKVSGSSNDACDQINPKPGGSMPRKKTSAKGASQQIPMLEYEDIPVDKTPTREKVPEKKVAQQIVEIVDLKCGSHDRDWSNPISNQLRRLSFSKLSE